MKALEKFKDDLKKKILACKYKNEVKSLETEVDNLDDVDNFQSAIENGIYFFAKRELNTETNMYEFKTESWDSIGGGAIGEVYDTTDDAQAEAEFKATSDKIQNIDKKLELQLNQLETERSAIQTEIDSISKVIDDNVESSFKTFS